MRWLKLILAFLLVLVLAFFLGAYLLPGRIELERRIDIDRPAATVFAVIDNLARFNEWSPWFDLDPAAKYRFEGPSSGPGAIMHWAGSNAVGTGTLRILDSQSPSRVDTQVVFDGFGEPAAAVFGIEPLSTMASRVTWSFSTDLTGPLARWFGLLMPGYIGKDYERGLQKLKALVETLPADDFGDLQVAIEDIEPIRIMAAAGSAPAGDMTAVASALGERYGRLIAFASAHGIEIAGQPLTLTDSPDGDVWHFEAALPVRPAATLPAEVGIEFKQTTGGPALVVEHVGPYDQLSSTLTRLLAYASAKGHVRNGPIQQIYVSDPGDTPPEALVTKIVMPVTNQRK
jgi:effector-binding domain-containing protein